MGWDQREAAAENLLARARLDAVVAPPLRAIVAALGWRLSAGVPRGAHGWLDLETATIHVDDHGSRAAVNERIAHELGHLAALLACMAHDEHDADAIAAAVAVPRRFVAQVVRSVGWDAPRLLETWPDARPHDVFARAATYGNGIAVVYEARHRVLAVAGDRAVVPALPGEQALVAAAKESWQPQRDPATGLRAWPMRGPYGAAIVLLGALDALADKDK